MCELLGMSANTPTDIRFSFTGLMQRGGGTGPHADGWGIAFYEGRGVRSFLDPQASVNSEVAQVVQNHPIKSECVVCHIRQANVGQVSLVNTHPFVRELWGRYWTFAHNGQLKAFEPSPGFYRPVGTTDSEALFCDLLNHIRTQHQPDTPDEMLIKTLVHRCAFYAQDGVFNLLLANGDWLFTFCSTKLAYITRRAPFGPASLKDADVEVDFESETTPDDIVTVIATEPLTTDEQWSIYERGEWRLWEKGETTQQGQVEVPKQYPESVLPVEERQDQ
ncbi:class II glutamine amidotransferase [Marinobacteraceae bacterium S3BR75-40.1]